MGPLQAKNELVVQMFSSPLNFYAVRGMFLDFILGAGKKNNSVDAKKGLNLMFQLNTPILSSDGDPKTFSLYCQLKLCKE